jgi:hypothetical protein
MSDCLIIIVILERAVANSFLESSQCSMSMSNPSFGEFSTQSSLVSGDCELQDMICSSSDTTFGNEEVVGKKQRKDWSKLEPC